VAKLLDYCGRAISTVAVLAALGVIGIYAGRIGLPLPLYAWDEDTYAMRALFSADVLASNPFSPAPGNNAFIGLVRLIHALSSNYLPWLRGVNVAAYATALWLVFRVGAEGAPRRTAYVWLLTAAAFPYYRFVVSGMPDA
jgi:hypothetical protein